MPVVSKPSPGLRALPLDPRLSRQISRGRYSIRNRFSAKFPVGIDRWVWTHGCDSEWVDQPGTRSPARLTRALPSY